MKSIKRDCFETVFKNEKGAIVRIITGFCRTGIFLCIPKFNIGTQIPRNYALKDIVNLIDGKIPKNNVSRLADKIYRLLNETLEASFGKNPAENIIKNPSTIKQMAEQIIIAIDAYSSLRFEENALKELILYYANKHGKKLFGKQGKINPTIRNIIGKKRCELVRLMLRGYQLSLF